MRGLSLRHPDYDDPKRRAELEAEMNRPPEQYTAPVQPGAATNLEMHEAIAFGSWLRELETLIDQKATDAGYTPPQPTSTDIDYVVEPRKRGETQIGPIRFGVIARPVFDGPHEHVEEESETG